MGNEKNSIGLRNDLIADMRRKLAEGTLTPADSYYNTSSLEILENSAGFEAEVIRLIFDVKTSTDKKLKLFDERMHDLSILDNKVLTLPPFFNEDHNYNI